MPVRPCITCGVLGSGSYCATHAPKKKPTPGRSSRPADRWRQAVLDAASHQCQWIDADGERCTATVKLQAHHLVRLRKLHAQGADLTDPALASVSACRTTGWRNAQRELTVSASRWGVLPMWRARVAPRLPGAQDQ